MTAPPPPECARLARELRLLRERTGLSLAGLAARTPAGKSSWQRYLTGAKLPPRELVEALCELAREPPGRLLALWELAESAWRRRGGMPAPGYGAAAPAGPARRPRVAVLAAVAAAEALAAGGLALVLSGDGSARAGQAPAPGCHGQECTGRDPQSLACSSAAHGPVVVARHELDGDAGMDIRHSAACGAGWARLWFGEVGDRLEIGAPGRGHQWVEVADEFDAQGYLHTPMIGAAPGELRVCHVPAGGDGRECFTP
ncbi:hypothetical protein GCM10009716_15600 [Streptomyces sodiiphilus]|uniref:HTH cro/C1-type domain-containing protein n=1 Tax=Streptomyces sodiiphilus TaxID=226217 RepID=A0ABN2NZ75_9ACTN